MLASTIQFTTNTPTPNKPTTTKVTNLYRWGQVRSAAPEPRQHAKPLKPRPLFAKKTGPNIFKRILNGLLAVPKQNSLERR